VPFTTAPINKPTTGSGLSALAFAKNAYQIFTRFSGARYSLSSGFTPKASYQASTLRTMPLTRK
jgi:hypothetical protein